MSKRTAKKKRQRAVDTKADTANVKAAANDDANPTTAVMYTYSQNFQKVQQLWIPEGYSVVDTKSGDRLTTNYGVQVSFIRGDLCGYDIQESPSLRGDLSPQVRKAMQPISIPFSALQAMAVFEKAKTVMDFQWFMTLDGGMSPCDTDSLEMATLIKGSSTTAATAGAVDSNSTSAKQL